MVNYTLGGTGVDFFKGSAAFGRALASHLECSDNVRSVKNGYTGLYIELKKETPYYKGQYLNLKKDKDERIEAQSRDLTRLNIEGYFACFAWSFDMAKVIVDYYMSEVNIKLPQIEPHTEYFYEFFDR